ncbi:MAG: hypothetical protein ABIH34_03000 [Nanoarchaeota archaeon]
MNNLYKKMIGEGSLLALMAAFLLYVAVEYTPSFRITAIPEGNAVSITNMDDVEARRVRNVLEREDYENLRLVPKGNDAFQLQYTGEQSGSIDDFFQDVAKKAHLRVEAPKSSRSTGTFSF